MRNLPVILNSASLVSFLVGTCFANPQVATTTTISPTPSTSAIPWPTKIEAFQSYILDQPDRNASKGFGYGPFLRKTFNDGECLQIGLYNWDCQHEIPYKMSGVAKWLNNTITHDVDPIWDAYRYYVYGYYVDPDDGWNFYGASRLSFGACGNRGPQSSCGVTYCVDEQGKTVGDPALVPKGETPYLDPNDRNRLCPWLRGNATVGN
jgi:hypothetical protein